MGNRKIIKYAVIISCSVLLIVLFLSIFNKSDNEPVIRKEVKANLNAHDIIDILNKRMVELEITAIELDDRRNKVIIYLENPSKEKIDNIKNIIDSPLMEFKQQGPLTFTQ